MRSAPGLALRGAPPPTRVLCPNTGCSQVIAVLPDGARVASRGATPTGHVFGKCPRCNHEFDVPTVEEVAHG